MTYAQTVEYLYNSTPVFEHVGASAYKEGLSNTIALDNHLGNPHRQFMTVHIAGTNGKGSCSHTIASVLQECGYKVGLYTSPHLVDFRERIRVNGKPISKARVIRFVAEEKHFFEPLHPSFFELTTAMAFKYFKEQHVDIAVVEVGLGGRLDCTNIISPILSVITNISFDHTQFLGNTLAKIAGEKAGIIKQATPVVIGEANEETRTVFAEKAANTGAPIIFAEDKPLVKDYQLTADGIVYNTTIGTLKSPLGGTYQVKNTNTALYALQMLTDILHIKNADKKIKAGFANVIENTCLMGRWQTINERPKAICDTGHNVGGWEYLSKQISMQPCKARRIVFGMVDDKDIHTVMEMLPKDAVYYFTQACSKRAVSAAKVAALGNELGLQGKAFSDVKTAYGAALSDASPDDFIFVGGSSYVVADLLE